MGAHSSPRPLRYEPDAAAPRPTVRPTVRPAGPPAVRPRPYRVTPDPVAPAGLGYPPPSAYVVDLESGYHYPAGLLPRTPPPGSAAARRRRRLPLGIAAAGAALALVGTGFQLSEAASPRVDTVSADVGHMITIP